ncbi:MAG: hypothetical protein ACKOE6_08225 [Flammeovirgaceae bacterium]
MGKKMVRQSAVFFVIAFVALNACQQKNSNQYPDQVGDIAFDEKVDDPAFKICDEKAVYQYYNYSQGVEYDGEKPAIRKKFSNMGRSSLGEFGYITMRFIVNCEGKIGRFRTQQMDTSYLEKKFDNEFVGELLSRTKSLDGWAIKRNEERKPIDYYQYLTFKIENGVVTEILP